MEGTLFVVLFTIVRFVLPVAGMIAIGEAVRRREARHIA